MGFRRVGKKGLGQVDRKRQNNSAYLGSWMVYKLHAARETKIYDMSKRLRFTWLSREQNNRPTVKKRISRNDYRTIFFEKKGRPVQVLWSRFADGLFSLDARVRKPFEK